MYYGKSSHCRPSSQYVGGHPVPVPAAPVSPGIVSGVKYNEWQRNSGLRVLRKVLDRQRLLEFESVNSQAKVTIKMSLKLTV